ncbi:hypothetical protein PIB30_078330, partial [Stylosanthes scabra]|nr:hypothetical protein [Stylosanthes scabra]
AGHNSRTCQQKKDDIADGEAAATAETAAGAAQQPGQNQQTENPGEAAPQVAEPSPPAVDSGSASSSHPVVLIETMNAASPSMRERFTDFMPTPSLTQPTGIGLRPSKLKPRFGPIANGSPSTKKCPSGKSGSSAKSGGTPMTNKTTRK